jgi:hypothetical protein
MRTLIYEVVSTRTGNTIAAFLLKTDAERYIKYLKNREGAHSAGYEVKENKK